MRAVALAFALTMIAAPVALAECNWGAKATVADAAKPAITAEAPLQTPARQTPSSTTRAGS